MKPVSVALALICAAGANADILDQHNDGPILGGTSIGTIGTAVDQSAAQTITVGLSGIMDRVEMYIYADGTPGYPLVLQVVPVSAGMPNTSTILATQGVTPTPTGFQWVSFDISAANLSVVPGQQLALVLSSSQHLDLGQYVVEGTIDLYPGDSFVRAFTGPWAPIPNYDLMFRTYVAGSAATGACCLPDASCTTTTSSACVQAGGIYHGDNSTCAGVSCETSEYGESGDAGESISTAAVVSGSGPLSRIRGTLANPSDIDLFQINICNPVAFSASTVGGTAIDTMLFLFRPDGTGIVGNDDASGSSQSTLTSQYTAALAPGNYYLGITSSSREPEDANGENLWNSLNPEQPPNGPGASNALSEWSAGGSGSGAYTITLQGACFVSSCYANCDQSTTPPLLNVLDFVCFLNTFAAGAPYANCDNSTTPPVLNVLDFVCFLNRFAAGCP